MRAAQLVKHTYDCDVLGNDVRSHAAILLDNAEENVYAIYAAHAAHAEHAYVQAQELVPHLLPALGCLPCKLRPRQDRRLVHLTRASPGRSPRSARPQRAAGKMALQVVSNMST